ncbi:VOC family protein [Herbiconiux daphne]|uniref:VOC family protein n=1 Tax=Herbiconiux daphne TaxID=2970914 RepID=A0ABT2H5M7_9MICO|nr:VOC family protein [Herbiconiux daphne]MCS5735237.1 VOC family protein [Herbiconiux daphne]
MLTDKPIDVVLLVTDLDRAKRFYGETLQLEVVDENEKVIVFRSGQTRLKASKSTVGTKDEQTQASWRVDDVRAEVEWLRSRGVNPEEYDDDEVTTVDGVADQGDAWVAWITDPDGNVLGIEQSKE